MDIEKMFKKNKNDYKLPGDFIKWALWSYSKEAYIKRNNHFDNLRNGKDLRAYFEYIIKNNLNIDVIINSVDDDWIRREKVGQCRLLVNNKTNLLKVLIDGIRNSIAHGTFSINNKKIIFISQYKSKEKSVIWFYLEMKYDNKILKNIMNLFEKFELCKNDYEYKITSLFYDSISKKILNTKAKDKLENREIIFKYDDEKFNRKKIDVLLSNRYKRNTLIIVNKMTNIDEKYLINQENKVKVLAIDKYFELVNK